MRPTKRKAAGSGRPRSRARPPAGAWPSAESDGTARASSSRPAGRCKSLSAWRPRARRRDRRAPDGHTRRSCPTAASPRYRWRSVSSLRARLGVSTALVIAAVVGLSTYLQARIVARAVEAEALDAAAAIALGVSADLGEHTTGAVDRGARRPTRRLPQGGAGGAFDHGHRGRAAFDRGRDRPRSAASGARPRSAGGGPGRARHLRGRAGGPAPRGGAARAAAPALRRGRGRGGDGRAAARAGPEPAGRLRVRGGGDRAARAGRPRPARRAASCTSRSRPCSARWRTPPRATSPRARRACARTRSGRWPRG